MVRDAALRVKGVVVASEMQAVRRQSGWQLDNLLGRLVEVSGAGDTAALTLATGILLETQMRGESAAWISAVDSLFYPPDFAAAGVDLEALPIVRVEKGLQAARAADALIRSGGFGALILDLGNQASMSLTVQTRLAGLARQHNVAVLALTRRSQGGGARLPSAGRFGRRGPGSPSGQVVGSTRRADPAARRMAGRDEGWGGDGVPAVEREHERAGEKGLRGASSLGSLVSLWAETRRERVSAVPSADADPPGSPAERADAGPLTGSLAGAREFVPALFDEPSVDPADSLSPPFSPPEGGAPGEKKHAPSARTSSVRWAETQTLNAQFVCQIDVRKDKRCGETWRHVELCRGPDGLC